MKARNKITALAALLAVALCGCTGEIESEPVYRSETQETSDGTEEAIWRFGGETITADKKEETVSVKADASGSPLEITVDTKLSGFSPDLVITDETNLTDIKNKTGDEQFELRDGVIYWENLGEDISYQGTSGSALPVTVKISYYLDGTEVTPSEIAGKSGSVKIRFDYNNNEKYNDVHVPFLCLSALILSEEHFSGVEVTNGTLMDLDGQTVVLGYAMPAVGGDLGLSDYESLEDIELPEYVEISADAEDFELGFTETIITSGIFSNIGDDIFSNLKDFTSGLTDLGEAGDELADGSAALSDGFGELQSAISAYLDGMSEVSSSISTLASGTQTLSDSTGQLVSGAKAISDALAAVDLSSLSSGIDVNAISQKLTAIGASAQSLASAGTYLGELCTSLSGILDEKTTLTDEEKQQVVAAFAASDAYTSLASTLASAGDGIASALSDLQNLFASMDTGSLDTMQEQFSQLQSGAKQVYEGMAALQSGIDTLNSGVSALNSGMSEAVANNDTVKSAMGEYKSGLSEFADGIKKLNDEGLSELADFGGKADELIGRIEALKEAEESYKTFTVLAEGQEGSVSFMIETEGVE